MNRERVLSIDSPQPVIETHDCPCCGARVPITGIAGGGQRRDPYSISSHGEDPQCPIFISYAWADGCESGSSREDIVDRLCESLRADGYDIRRDKTDLPYRGLIREFMQEIGRGCVIAVISDKYLRSPNCMYELLETHRNLHFRERFCPILLSDAAIHSLPDRLEYVAYWKREFKRIEKLVKKVGISVLSAEGSLCEYKEYQEITQRADELLSILADINTQTPALVESNNFEALKHAVDEWLEPKVV